MVSGAWQAVLHLVVAGGDRPVPLEPPDQALDGVAVGVDKAEKGADRTMAL